MFFVCPYRRGAVCCRISSREPEISPFGLSEAQLIAAVLILFGIPQELAGHSARRKNFAVMKTVTLISKDDCHLCETAKSVVLRTQKKIAFDLKEEKIAPGTEEFDKYHERVPVVLIDGKIAFQFKVSELQLLQKLIKKN